MTVCPSCPQGQLGSTQDKGLIPCVLLVLKEMLPTYHKWRYNTHGVRERIGEYLHKSMVVNYISDIPFRICAMFV